MDIRYGVNIYMPYPIESEDFLKTSEVKSQNRKVRFLNKNGYDSERERALKILVEGESYDLEEVFIGRSSTTIKLSGIVGEFNSVMFEDDFSHLNIDAKYYDLINKKIYTKYLDSSYINVSNINKNILLSIEYLGVVKLAYELGFKNNNTKEVLLSSPNIQCKQNIDIVKDCEMFDKLGIPTPQDIQKWILNEKGMFVWMSPIIESSKINGYGYAYFINDLGFIHSDDEFKTQDEALEQGLFNLLNYIKNGK